MTYTEHCASGTAGPTAAQSLVGSTPRNAEPARRNHRESNAVYSSHIVTEYKSENSSAYFPTSIALVFFTILKLAIILEITYQKHAHFELKLN
jgi:hypothetical protein